MIELWHIQNGVQVREILNDDVDIRHYKPHRLDGPAVIMSHSLEAYEAYDQGFINYSLEDYEAWYVDGKMHRTDGPAKYWQNTTNMVDPSLEIWCYEDKFHREDGPAYYDSRAEVWIKHNLKHREYAPAYINYKNPKKNQWHLNGVYVSPQIEHWMATYKIPHWTEWTTEHKIMFRLKFMG